MKLSLNVFLHGATLSIESDDMGALTRAFITARQLSTEGHLPSASPIGGSEYDAPPTTPYPDSGVVFPSDNPDVPVSSPPVEADPEPTPERETEQPGKSKKARKAAEPAKEAALPPAAAPVPREVAQQALAGMLRDKGSDAVAKLLNEFGVTRFGLYVADDYAEFVAAIEGAK